MSALVVRFSLTENKPWIYILSNGDSKIMGVKMKLFVIQ